MSSAVSKAPPALEHGEGAPKRFWWGHPEAERILLRWHGDVTGPENGGARSALRRVPLAEDACLVPEFGELVVGLRAAGFTLSARRAIEMAAEAVAAAEIDINLPLAEPAGKPGSGSPAPGRGAGEERAGEEAPKRGRVWLTPERIAEGFSRALASGEIAPARARLLLSTDDPALFLRLLRGTLAMLRARRQPVPVAATAEIVRRWRDPEPRAEVRRHIALALAERLDDK